MDEYLWLVEVAAFLAAALYLLVLYRKAEPVGDRRAQLRQLRHTRQPPPAPTQQQADAQPATPTDTDSLQARIADAVSRAPDVDVSDLPLESLAGGWLQTEKITTLRFKYSHSGFDLSALRESHVSKLVISGGALAKSALQVLGDLHSTPDIDLVNCQTTVIAKNTAASSLATPQVRISWTARAGKLSFSNRGGFQDIFEFSWARRSATSRASLLLPAACAFEIGEVVRGFPKVGVVVIALRFPLRIGDVIEFRRTGAAASEWKSSQTVVRSMRNDGHDQLLEAVPRADAVFGSIDTQFSAQVVEVGKKGDAIFWLGHRSE
eukprot:m.163271 g.163271  ORF g.163271 m.163271 type:complete len:321 (+) comp53076_c0_seq2:739-1701(+)